MLQQDVEISNKLGLHARASAKLTQAASQFQSAIWLTRNQRRVNAKSIMGVMLLAAGQGSSVLLRVDGDDEAAAADAVAELFARRFDEAD